MLRFNRVVLVASLLVAPAFMSPAFAQNVEFKAQLAGSQEVPPTTSSGMGTFTGSFVPATKVMTYRLEYQGLSGPASAAHLHGPAATGANAPVTVPFTASPSPISGTATLTDAQAADLMAGRYYANVHTQANPMGEIRGQVTH